MFCLQSRKIFLSSNQNLSMKVLKLINLMPLSFFPSINIQTNHSWNVGLNQNITTGILENLTTQYTSMGANVGVSIYRVLSNINQLHRANLSLLARQYQLDDIKDDILLFVANSYLQVMFNREILEVQKTQLKSQKKI